MKKKILYLSILGVVLLSLNSCYKDVLYPDFDPNAPVSFNGELVPIFVKNCADAGCHDAVPAHKPALTADKAYNAIKSGGYIDLLVPEQSKIYSMVKSGEMPPSGALTASDAQRILNWIKAGAPNN